MGKLLKKSDIFAKKSLTPRTVYVPDWDGDVIYKPMTMSERREIRKKCVTTSPGAEQSDIDQEMMELWAIITCVLDPDDAARKKLLFGPEDINVLESQLAAGAISVVSLAILKASGLGPSSFRDGEEEPQE